MEAPPKLYDAVERGHSWPTQVLWALIAMVLKPNSMQPGDLRPITVSSLIYTVWAGIRCKEQMLWQEEWLWEGATGFRKGASPELSSFELAAQLQHAMVHNTSAVWLQFDLTKCFDMLQWDPLFEIVERLGANHRVTRPIGNAW